MLLCFSFLLCFCAGFSFSFSGSAQMACFMLIPYAEKICVDFLASFLAVMYQDLVFLRYPIDLYICLGMAIYFS